MNDPYTFRAKLEGCPEINKKNYQHLNYYG
jgi:hypothetical protein